MIKIENLSIGHKVLRAGKQITLNKDDFAQLESDIEKGLIEGIEINSCELKDLNFFKSVFKGESNRWYHKELEIAYDVDDNYIRVGGSWEFGTRKFVHELQHLISALKHV